MKNFRVILGVSGGIAAYKAPFIIRLLKQKGASVQVVCTPNALEFVTLPVLETLSENRVYIDMFPKTYQQSAEHISITDNADIMLVAPATGNVIGKFASGIADDALTTSFMAFDGPVFIAPAMNTKMWNSPVVQKNVDFLKSLGHTFIGPAAGDLACGYKGSGRMLEPHEIVDEVLGSLASSTLGGQRILVTAGPTFEKIDPVRYLGNFSTGRMGYAVASALAARGAEVVLVSGPVHLQADPRVKLIQVESAQQMHNVCVKHFPNCQAAVMTAAVADFRPKTSAKSKIKKEQNASLNIELELNPDILATIGGMKKAGQIVIGFALETTNELANAQKKLDNKKADIIVLNSLNDPGSGFGHDTNKITLIRKSGKPQPWPLMSKTEAASVIADELEKLLS
ncbi:MAG: bifunctional phosphopantothenoylcysteine decarboxylase/phosphopantothenate--cysteine ligase CoaBC, partial [Bacteroidales bacterium]|nr:bifunctional phosphopantothenoylcysteine decarboxylase/phosphopantothenate--cysteine ligase CoaBC [Bacteroidales bacterium]